MQDWRVLNELALRLLLENLLQVGAAARHVNDDIARPRVLD